MNLRTMNGKTNDQNGEITNDDLARMIKSIKARLIMVHSAMENNGKEIAGVGYDLARLTETMKAIRPTKDFKEHS